MRRVLLFVRDFFEEVRGAWSLARYRDCERRGHEWSRERWDSVLFDGPAQECIRCGCSRSVPTTATTVASSSSVTINVGEDR